jgi:hypothetical protein
VPVFPLKGGAIVARGVTAGPAVARILQAVEARWVAEGFPDAGADRRPAGRGTGEILILTAGTRGEAGLRRGGLPPQRLSPLQTSG